MGIRLILLVLGLCALAQVDGRPAQLEKQAPLEKTTFYEKRHPSEKAALEKRYLQALEKRGYPYDISIYKRQLIEKRNALPAQYTYIGPAPQPAQQPAPTVYYYYQMPDGTLKLVQGTDGGAPQVQQPLVQTRPVQQPAVQQPLSQGYQEVPYQPPASSSSGGLLNLLSKPFSTVSKVIGVTGDLVQGVVDLPFSVAKDLVQSVGLDQSLIGKAATGILDTGATIVKAPVELVKNVGQLPFELVSNVVEGLEEE